MRNLKAAFLFFHCRMEMLCRLPKIPPPTFVANHPFIIIILQAKQLNKHNILFSGRISEPKH
ncbi:hypothetical protein NQ317_015060 [Molorchus minor]|uniref:Uncharacterized protein n=1 Tax=Molorchus minor TaxID=1323400 RepID=A0ABQ9K565_9CUCU|nr:hypothetical protein NQ317_015060 [Molorchus minor]